MLPQWLAEPDVIHRDIKSNLVPVSDVSGVCPELLKKLQKNGIHHFFPGEERFEREKSKHAVGIWLFF